MIQTILEYTVPIFVIVIFLSFLIGKTRNRRIRKALANRDANIWEEGKDLCKIVGDTFELPQDCVAKLRPDDTFMKIYLMVYPSHCMYDEMEHVTFLKLFEEKAKISIKEDEISKYYDMKFEELQRMLKHE